MLSVEMQAIAKDLIDQFGNTYTLQKIDIQGYNPHTHKNDITVQDIVAKGVPETITTGGYYSGNQQATLDGIVRLGDTKITMYAEVDDIDESWTVDGNNILFISKVGFQDNLIIYDVFVRIS